MGWRRETWMFLGWIALTVGAFYAVSDLGAAGLGLVECHRWVEGSSGIKLGPCGDGLYTLALELLVLLVGGIGLLVTIVLWVRSRPQLRCPGCHVRVEPGDATCPRCGRDLRGTFGPPPGWGSTGHR